MGLTGKRVADRAPPVRHGAERPSGFDELQRAFRRSFEVLEADNESLRREAYALRYQVYCVENAFEDPADSRDGLETDVFDTRSWHALLRHRPTGLCAGTLRLVSADASDPRQRFPLEVFCASALSAADRARMAELPRARTGEISRFAISKQFRRRYAEHLTTTGITEANLFGDSRRGETARRAMPYLTIGLFCGLFRLAVHYDIEYLYAVMEPSLLRLLRRFGVHFEPLGNPVEYHGVRQCAIGYLPGICEDVRRVRPDIWDLAAGVGGAA